MKSRSVIKTGLPLSVQKTFITTQISSSMQSGMSDGENFYVESLLEPSFQTKARHNYNTSRVPAGWWIKAQTPAMIIMTDQENKAVDDKHLLRYGINF